MWLFGIVDAYCELGRVAHCSDEHPGVRVAILLGECDLYQFIRRSSILGRNACCHAMMRGDSCVSWEVLLGFGEHEVVFNAHPFAQEPAQRGQQGNDDQQYDGGHNGWGFLEASHPGCDERQESGQCAS